MSTKGFFIYLLIMALSTHLIRAIPFALLRKKIQNPFIKSFLYYIPYTVLTVMTIPGALYATGNIWAAGAGLVTAALFAIRGKGLTVVAAAACVAVFAAEVLFTLL